MGSRIKNLFSPSKNNNSNNNNSTSRYNNNSSNHHLLGHSYEDAIALEPPLKGSYSVAGNGRNVLSEIQHAQSARAKRLSRPGNVPARSTASRHVVRRVDDVPTRPRTATGIEAAWGDGGEGEQEQEQEQEERRGRKRTHSMKSQRMSAFSFHTSGQEHSTPPPLPKPTRDIPTYQSTGANGAGGGITGTGTGLVSASFTRPYAQHSRTSSHASHTTHIDVVDAQSQAQSQAQFQFQNAPSSPKSHVDLLDAHSIITHSREPSLGQGRRLEQGNSRYGEDVADRNIAKHGNYGNHASLSPTAPTKREMPFLAMGGIDDDGSGALGPDLDLEADNDSYDDTTIITRSTHQHPAPVQAHSQPLARSRPATVSHPPRLDSRLKNGSGSGNGNGNGNGIGNGNGNGTGNGIGIGNNSGSGNGNRNSTINRNRLLDDASATSNNGSMVSLPVSHVTSAGRGRASATQISPLVKSTGSTKQEASSSASPSSSPPLSSPPSISIPTPIPYRDPCRHSVRSSLGLSSLGPTFRLKEPPPVPPPSTVIVPRDTNPSTLVHSRQTSNTVPHPSTLPQAPSHRPQLSNTSTIRDRSLSNPTPRSTAQEGSSVGPISKHTKSQRSSYSAFPYNSQTKEAKGMKDAIAAQQLSQRPGLSDVVDLTDTVDTDVTTKTLPAVVHEHVTPTQHEIRTKAITREVHTHHVYHRVLPVIETEILPVKHYVKGSDGNLVPILESEVSRHSLTARPNAYWESNKAGVDPQALHRPHSQASSTEVGDAATPPSVGYTRDEAKSTRSRGNSLESKPEPILSNKKESTTKDGHTRTDYVWRHPPVFETMDGNEQPIIIGTGYGDPSSEESLGSVAAADIKDDEALLFTDTGYGSDGMLPGLKEKSPMAGLGNGRVVVAGGDDGLGRSVGDVKVDGSPRELRRKPIMETTRQSGSVAEMERGMGNLSMRH